MKKILKKIKMTYYSIRLRMNLVSKNIYFANLPRLSRGKKILFAGDNIYIGFNCHLGGNIKFGDDILIGSNVSFVGGDHKIDFLETSMFRSGRDKFKDIIIEDDVWIGHGSIILHGVTLHNGCVVAAGSIVTKNVPENAIVGGNPAKVIRYRKFNQYE